MKKRCLRLLSCIFIIAMFFGGLCFYNVQTALTEISYETEADFHDFQLITTPKSSINDYRPCTSEMLGKSTPEIRAMCSLTSVNQIYMLLINYRVVIIHTQPVSCLPSEMCALP